MSHRSLCALVLTLSALPLGTAACSAAGDGSETDGAGSSSSKGGASSGSAAGSPNLNPTAGSTSLPALGGMTGVGGGGDACGQVLPVLYRDFKAYGEPGGHADFEASARGVKQTDGATYKGWNDVGCGLIEPALGTTGKPRAYAGAPDIKMGGPATIKAGVGRQQRKVAGTGCWTAANPTPVGTCGVGTCVPWEFDPPTYSIESATTFDQWYTTIANVNMEVPGELLLTASTPGVSVFDTNAFFPIDGKGFGNTPGQSHNYHFTTEIHVKFKYEAGQVFTFRGDDDLWIFVNGKLALDVGGQHQALEGTIRFDDQAAALGIMAGGSYPMDIFHAERQTSESNFRIETNIKCFEPVVK